MTVLEYDCVMETDDVHETIVRGGTNQCLCNLGDGDFN